MLVSSLNYDLGSKLSPARHLEMAFSISEPSFPFRPFLLTFNLYFILSLPPLSLSHSSLPLSLSISISLDTSYILSYFFYLVCSQILFQLHFRFIPLFHYQFPVSLKPTSSLSRFYVSPSRAQYLPNALPFLFINSTTINL